MSRPRFVAPIVAFAMLLANFGVALASPGSDAPAHARITSSAPAQAPTLATDVLRGYAELEDDGVDVDDAPDALGSRSPPVVDHASRQRHSVEHRVPGFTRLRWAPVAARAPPVS